MNAVAPDSDELRASLLKALVSVGDGNQADMGMIYDATSGVLLATIYRIVRSQPRAEDILQDVYIKIWRGAGGYRATKGSPMTWMRTIARNAAIDSIRRDGRAVDSGEASAVDANHSAVGIDGWLYNPEEQIALHRCIETLQADHRQSIRLIYFNGYTQSELSDHSGVPIGTVKSWISRALATLRRCLDA